MTTPDHGYTISSHMNLRHLYKGGESVIKMVFASRCRAHAIRTAVFIADKNDDDQIYCAVCSEPHTEGASLVLTGTRGPGSRATA